MEGIIGRIQTEADDRGKRTDIHLETNVNAIKMDDGTSAGDVVKNIGVSVSMSTTTPTHSSLWIIPD